MVVELLYHTPLWVAAKAIRKCWASEGNSDTADEIIAWEGRVFTVEGNLPSEPCPTIGPKDAALIDRVGNKNKHASTLEHLVYTFDIDGMSRAVLQEHARHRISSFSVQSSRYTLQKVIDGFGDISETLVRCGDKDIDDLNLEHMTKLAAIIERRGKTLPRDKAKYGIVEAYKTSLVWTVNARSLQNFLALRTNKAALQEIRELAYLIYATLPEDHKYLFEDSLYAESH